MSFALVLAGLVGMAFLVGSVILRSQSGNRYELKSIDVALLLLPVAVWLLWSGKIQKFAFSGLEVEVAEAFISASEESVEAQVVSIEETGLDDVVEVVERDSKGGVDQIPRLIERKTEALTFRMGHGGYWGPAIQQYFESLLAHGYLRYIVVNNSDGTLFGLYMAPSLLRYFREVGPSSYVQFAKALNTGSAESKTVLSRLPDYVSADDAVVREMSRRQALERMENSNEDVLPVVDGRGRFAGTVSRSKLTASLILEVTGRLDSKVADARRTDR